MALSKYSEASNHAESRRLALPSRMYSAASDAISEKRKPESTGTVEIFSERASCSEDRPAHPHRLMPQVIKRETENAWEGRMG